MSAQNNGGQAFPVASDNFNTEGMTLRDYFAAKAMQAFISDPKNLAIANQAAKEKNTTPTVYISLAAYDFADAMLAAREV